AAQRKHTDTQHTHPHAKLLPTSLRHSRLVDIQSGLPKDRRESRLRLRTYEELAVYHEGRSRWYPHVQCILIVLLDLRPSFLPHDAAPVPIGQAHAPANTDNRFHIYIIWLTEEPLMDDPKLTLSPRALSRYRSRHGMRMNLLQGIVFKNHTYIVTVLRGDNLPRPLGEPLAIRALKVTELDYYDRGIGWTNSGV